MIENEYGNVRSMSDCRCRSTIDGTPTGWRLFDLPILERLRTRLDAFKVGVDAVGARRVVRLLRRSFETACLLLVAALLALPFALALLL